MADADSRAGARYASAEILHYVEGVHASHDAGLARAFQAPGQHGVPAIQLSAIEGRLLEWLARLIGARRVVEVGTLVGYSAIRLARGVGPQGQVFSIEHDPRHAELARQNIAAAGFTDRVTVVEGDGPDALASLAEQGPFDLVFVDADKARYDVYGRWARAHLRSGGLLVGDNVFLFGRLLDASDEAKAMRRFHEECAEHFDSACISTPDGLLVGRLP